MTNEENDKAMVRVRKVQEAIAALLTPIIGPDSAIALEVYGMVQASDGEVKPFRIHCTAAERDTLDEWVLIETLREYQDNMLTGEIESIEQPEIAVPYPKQQ